MEADHKLIIDVYARAGELSKVTNLNSPMTWRGGLYDFVRLKLWHRWLRPMPARIRSWLPDEPKLRYAGTVVAILVALATLAEKAARSALTP